uniref:Hypothethical protein n=1 Tax=Ralstonia solanacearum TaxID=305 RepID=A0A0S4WDL4_RALSL|nr:Hypothethical protein [Ralstonia solanacearum]
MLLTEFGCEESQAVRRHLVHPYQPWRYVAITVESPCFLIERDRGDRGADSLLSAYLVPSAEELLQIVEYLGHGACRVYKVVLAGKAERRSQLDPITALHSYTAGGVQWFSCEGQDGAIHPCLPGQPKADTGAVWVTEWRASVRSVSYG